MRRTKNIIWGIVIIVFGVLLGMRALNILDFKIFFGGWWTLFIIVPCVAGLFTSRDKLGNLIGILIGVTLLMGCQDIIDFDLIWKLAVPVIIILIGINMIFKGSFGSGKAMLQSGGLPARQCTAVFSEQNVDYINETFDGAELTAVFGSIKLDLRNAFIENDAKINVCTVFGGIDILVPDNINIKTNVTGVFGGADGGKHTNKQDNAVTVYINGICIFGGVDIK